MSSMNEPSSPAGRSREQRVRDSAAGTTSVGSSANEAPPTGGKSAPITVQRPGMSRGRTKVGAFSTNEDDNSASPEMYTPPPSPTKKSRIPVATSPKSSPMQPRFLSESTEALISSEEEEEDGSSPRSSDGWATQSETSSAEDLNAALLSQKESMQIEEKESSATNPPDGKGATKSDNDKTLVDKLDYNSPYNTDKKDAGYNSTAKDDNLNTGKIVYKIGVNSVEKDKGMKDQSSSSLTPANAIADSRTKQEMQSVQNQNSGLDSNSNEPRPAVTHTMRKQSESQPGERSEYSEAQAAVAQNLDVESKNKNIASGENSPVTDNFNFSSEKSFSAGKSDRINSDEVKSNGSFAVDKKKSLSSEEEKTKNNFGVGVERKDKEEVFVKLENNKDSKNLQGVDLKGSDDYNFDEEKAINNFIDKETANTKNMSDKKSSKTNKTPPTEVDAKKKAEDAELSKKVLGNLLENADKAPADKTTTAAAAPKSPAAAKKSDSKPAAVKPAAPSTPKAAEPVAAAKKVVEKPATPKIAAIPTPATKIEPKPAATAIPDQPVRSAPEAPPAIGAPTRTPLAPPPAAFADAATPSKPSMTESMITVNTSDALSNSSSKNVSPVSSVTSDAADSVDSTTFERLEMPDSPGSSGGDVILEKLPSGITDSLYEDRRSEAESAEEDAGEAAPESGDTSAEEVAEGTAEEEVTAEEEGFLSSTTGQLTVALLVVGGAVLAGYVFREEIGLVAPAVSE